METERSHVTLQQKDGQVCQVLISFLKYDDFLIKRFEQSDKMCTFEKGKFEMVKMGSMTIGHASYEPGPKWSVCIDPATGASSCEVEHIGLVFQVALRVG